MGKKTRKSSDFLKKVKKSFFKIGTEFEQQFRKCLITKDLRGAGGRRPVSRWYSTTYEVG